MYIYKKPKFRETEGDSARGRERERERERERDLRQRSTSGSVTLPPRHSQPTQSVHWRRVHSLHRRKKKQKKMYTKIHSWSGPLSLVCCQDMDIAAVEILPQSKAKNIL